MTRWPGDATGRGRPESCCRSGWGSRSRPWRRPRWLPLLLAGPRLWPGRTSGPRRSAPGGPRTARAARKRQRRRLAGRRRRRAVACDAAMAPISPATSTWTRWRTGPALRELDGRRDGGGTRPGPGWSRPSSARPSTAVGPRRAGQLPAPPGAAPRAGRARPWTRLLRDRPAGIRTPSCCGTGTASGPAAATAAGACQVHHTKHKANGGKNSVKDCVLLCPFHHQVVIHHWAWTLVVNPDGTTTAWNKDKTKVLHSHGHPQGPGTAR